MSYSTKCLVTFKVKGSAFLFNVEESLRTLIAMVSARRMSSRGSYGSVTIVCNEHKWGLRIGTDDGKARPFAGLKFYGLETRALGEARQYE
ncbi:MAG: hypothetical protein ACLS3M_04650 [Collinsella sp.]